jgi:hypothetical protein
LKGLSFSDFVNEGEGRGYSVARAPTKEERHEVLLDWMAAKYGPTLVKGQTFSYLVSTGEGNGYRELRAPTHEDYRDALDAYLDAAVKQVTVQVWVAAGESGHLEDRTQDAPGARAHAERALALKLIRAHK